MAKFIRNKLLHFVFVMLGVSFLTFSLTSLLPSDPVTMKYQSMQQQVDKKIIDAEKEALGLNRSFPEQYMDWLVKALKGDLGMSVRYNKPVSQKLSEALPNTLILSGLTLIFTAIIAIPLGILAAFYQNKLLDYIIRFGSFLGLSMPSFWLALILIYWFSVHWNILPVTGSTSMVHFILPAITYATWLSAVYIRQIRNAILEEWQKPYIIGLRALGLPDWQIMIRYGLPNALLPLVTTLGLAIGTLLGGSVIIENIFNMQGLGSLVVEAVRTRDYALVQGYVLWLSCLFVVINTSVDILYQLLQPSMKAEV